MRPTDRELRDAVTGEDWDGCQCFAEADSGIHICVQDLGHAGECLCGSCGAYFRPEGSLGRETLAEQRRKEAGAALFASPSAPSASEPPLAPTSSV